LEREYASFVQIAEVLEAEKVLSEIGLISPE
jgi:hypothetical protein